MTAVQPITPCLWFDTQAEEAARFYTAIFKNSKIGTISRYGEAGREIHGGVPGTVLTVEFELNGQPFTADRYGLSWQVVPSVLVEMISDPDREKSGRAMQAMLQMKKLDIAKLERAFAG